MKTLASACLIALAMIVPTHADLHITEFMELNGGSLKDEDGDGSDWIELFNSGPDSVDLEGYFLTDDEAALPKWSLPALQLDRGSFLLVFASEKNRSVVGSELHTNFKLADGDYLALVDPDGTTVIAEFGSAADPLPPQFEDVSYGLMQNGNRTPSILIDVTPSGTAHVPADATLGETWQALAFDDTEWTPVISAVGYDEATTYDSYFGAGGDLDNTINNVNTTLYLRFPFSVSESGSISELTLKMKYDDGFAAFLNGVRVADANAPGVLSWNSDASAQHSDGEAQGLVDFDISVHAHLLVNGPNLLAIHGLNDSITSSDMLISPELHAVRVTDPSIGSSGFLARPSPGGLNGDTFGGFVRDTKFSSKRGFYDAPFDVAISSNTEGANIRYTTDGSTPTIGRGNLYTGPISITTTTTLRAIAYKTGCISTNVDTHTYIFPEDVVDQARMRDSVTQSATLGPQMVDSLKSVPTVSIVTANPGPFQNEGGGNIRSESPASVEMIFPDGTPGFQEDGGLKHFGGYYTNFPKKSFRIGFRSKYGATKINYPIFEGFDYKHYPPTDRFDVMDLRSGSHDMSSRGAYMSNRFTDDSMLDMGNLAPHGRFVHVYLNGSYWGQYHLRERWNADMASSYLGGPKEDYDAVNLNDNFQADEKVYDGTGVFWNEAKALASGPNPWANNDNNIDVANLIDFMLLWVSGNSESEVRLLGSKAQGQPFRFQMKDADGYLRSTSRSVSDSGPLNLMSRLRSGNTDFAMLLADRIHKHYFNDGAMTSAQNIERLRKRVDEARPGFIAESARWGNRFREYQNWLSYQNNLVNNHFPGLAQTMVGRFRSTGMYPDVIAPVFNQHGGSISDDTPLTMSTDADKIYYTFDGSDPRLIGGTPNPAATEASFGGGGPGEQQPVTYMTTGYTWKYLDNGSNQGAEWRASDFNDTAWSSGPSPLGYGGDGEATELSFGGDSRNKHATTYYRTTVEIPNPTVFLNFLLRVKYDDGATVYINGVEQFRQNLAAGAGFDDFANGTTADEASWKDATLPTTALVPGTNTIAVEIHQGSGTSSDTRMDLTLRGQTSNVGGGDNVTTPFNLSKPTLVRARGYNSTSGEWSALNEAFFTVDSVPADASNLVVSEFHYRPAKPTTPTELAISSDRDDFEFLELFNIGESALDMNDVRFTSGINFSFPDNVVLEIGERILLLRDRDAFEARYGQLLIQSFEFTGRLSNDGEQILILGTSPDPIKDFIYNDQAPWPTAADGGGPSLILVDSTSNPNHNEPNNWMISQNEGGSPGTEEPSGLTYDTWASDFDLQGGPLDDDDGDQLLNFFEFLHGSSPVDSSDAPVPMASVQAIDVGGSTDDYLTLTFNKSAGIDGVLTVEVSSDLANWSSDRSLTELVSSTDNGDGTSTVRVRVADPISPEQGRIYLRLRGR